MKDKSSNGILGRIIHFEQVKKSEVGGHSPNMEVLGVKRGLKFLLDQG